ncbi:MAG: PTS sugar transporter subunit IIC [Solobacterium sp.]|nr:PTS sugar transporter subunit IIC [Solobacterium sp.]
MWQKFEDKLISWAGIVSRNTVLNVIQHSFMLIFPFMMIGSIFTLIVGFPNETWTALLASAGLDTILQIPVQYTTEFISIYLVYAVAYYFTIEKGNKENSIVTGLISIFAFVILIPYITTGEGWAAVTSIPFTYTGARGMFLALFVGFAVGGFCAYANKKNWTIKMPDSVPPFVSKSFASLIPAVVITLAALAIRYAFGFTSYGSVFAWFYTLLQKPLSAVTSGPWGVAIIETISMLLWWLGIHGGAVTYQIKNLLFAENRLANVAAYAAGQPLPNAVTGLFLTVGVMPLILVCWLVGKSQRTKAVTKVAAVPAIFGISEPVNFGLPTVLNPVMLIPSIIIYPISVFFTYFLNIAGLLPFCNGTQIRNCPYFILAFLQFGGIKGLFWWIVLFIISCLIYLPFVKALDKKYVQEEAEAEAGSTAVDENNTDYSVTVTCAKPEKIAELLGGKEISGISFTYEGTAEHSVTLSFDKSIHSKKEVVKALKKYFKEDDYFSGLMVTVK